MPTYDLPEAIDSRRDFIAALPKANDSYKFTPSDSDVFVYWDDGVEEVSFVLHPAARQIELPDGFPAGRLDRLSAALTSYETKKPRVIVREKIEALIAALDGTLVNDLTNADLKLLVLMLSFRSNLIEADEAGDLVVSIPDRWWR